VKGDEGEKNLPQGDALNMNWETHWVGEENDDTHNFLSHPNDFFFSSLLAVKRVENEQPPLCCRFNKRMRQQHFWKSLKKRIRTRTRSTLREGERKGEGEREREREREREEEGEKQQRRGRLPVRSNMN
jgi:hypothetical protein